MTLRPLPLALAILLQAVLIAAESSQRKFADSSRKLHRHKGEVGIGSGRLHNSTIGEPGSHDRIVDSPRKLHKHKGEAGAAGRLRNSTAGVHGGGGSLVHKTALRIAQLLRLSSRLPVIKSEDDLATVASAIATVDREILFTTISIDRPMHQLIFLRQWQGNLRAAAGHVLVLGADERTCRAARNATIPCFVDGVAPTLRGKQNMFGHQVLLKWWYAKELLNMNFHLIFSDPDIAWLADPFSKWDHSFDLQGLSDIRSVNLTVQKHHEITCMRPWMEQMYEHARRSIYPCQSTGLWFMRDRPQSRALLEGLYGYLSAKPNEWEQKAFQLIVMRYLVGLGDDLPPLRYRLLPTRQFINIEFYEERMRRGMPSERTAVGVHCGYLKNTADKLEHLQLTGFLRRGLTQHRRLYQAIVALGETGHGDCCGADERLYGHDERTIHLDLKRKNHSTFSIDVRRRAR